jgi:uncharacterized protein YeaO (DUF488 family)
MLKVKRVYEKPSVADGERFLVDRLWPRGLKKQDARLKAWLRDLAPSAALRRWFSHDPHRWEEFQRRYIKELEDPEKTSQIEELLQQVRQGTATLVFAAKDEEKNNAVVLKHYLEQRLGSATR